MTLEKITEKIHEHLSEKNQIRDNLMAEIRKVLKGTRQAISSIHRRELKFAESFLSSTKETLSAIQAEFAKIPLLPVVGLLHNAEGEFAEATFLLSFLKNKPLPSPEAIGVSEMGYLLGLGDLIGELRRVTVDALKDDDQNMATRAFTLMEQIYGVLLTFDFPRALLPGIRQKTDIARGLVERTRADLSLNIQRRRLAAKMESLEKTLTRK